ncbi:WYL domain-containing protein [Saccharibacillus sp. CPCC 101409]|uniref:helix-turn-helix transcriptional regulator n=1 Tax=Saccharibacillus sp. CPCC 101409 TaxID=3058041 RepID=UPI0026717292|nr:WYL domain-containing protein [Saccharibacillus sp. CPCC 101409]MDO3408337.1 WYL domain-containing protein [Saccharibacillus sp. CPCC 101409]
MAKESFDKEIQFLRLLALTGGGYDRQQFAGRLGISVHTFDKTVRRLREISGDADFADLFRYGYADSAEPVLLFLYRAKSMKESESRRLPLILASLKQQPLTAAELLDACCQQLPAEAAMPDEKTIRSDLRYLEEIGVVRRQPGGRPFRYVLNNDLTDCLSQKELIDLYEFVDIMANTQIPSVQGYLLRDNLKKALKSAVPEDDWNDGLLEPFSYKYHYDARILDEAHLYTVLQMIRLRKRISFQYFSPKNRKSYAAKDTNPLFGRENEIRRESTLPLKVVYDHQYGRWYMIGSASKGRIVKFRMEGMIDIAEEQEVPEPYFTQKTAELDERMRCSWLIDTGETVTVRARFYRPGREQADFIEERVRLQGQWGEIVEADEESFVYEIRVNGVTEIRPWLRGFGSSCEVLEPAALRQSFIDEWKEIGDYYDASI